jgi:hypothetical protein
MRVPFGNGSHAGRRKIGATRVSELVSLAWTRYSAAKGSPNASTVSLALKCEASPSTRRAGRSCPSRTYAL